jgi:hypothetical protein
LDQHDEADVVNSTIKTLICPAFIMYINKKVKHYREKESEFIIYISLLFIKLKKKKKELFIFPKCFKTTTSYLSH